MVKEDIMALIKFGKTSVTTQVIDHLSSSIFYSMLLIFHNTDTSFSSCFKTSVQTRNPTFPSKGSPKISFKNINIKTVSVFIYNSVQ